MNYIDTNERALNLLSKENFIQAQKLFFKNAKSTQSHETYNNLGWYLYTEGLECKNGKVRNAEKLGLHYLLKAKKNKAYIGKSEQYSKRYRRTTQLHLLSNRN